MRLRAEVRRSRVAQAGPVVSVGIGATRLRRPQSVTPPATDCGLAPALCPPRYGVSASPWSCAPPRRRSGLASGITTFALTPRSGAAPLATAFRPRPGAALPATAPRPRSGAVPPRRRIGIGLVPRPPRQRFDPALGATTFALELPLRSRACAPARAFRPRSGVVPPLSGRAMRKTAGFGRWRSKQTVFRGLGSGKWTILPVVRVGAFR